MLNNATRICRCAVKNRAAIPVRTRWDRSRPEIISDPGDAGTGICIHLKNSESRRARIGLHKTIGWGLSQSAGVELVDGAAWSRWRSTICRPNWYSRPNYPRRRVIYAYEMVVRNPVSRARDLVLHRGIKLMCRIGPKI